MVECPDADGLVLVLEEASEYLQTLAFVIVIANGIEAEGSLIEKHQFLKEEGGTFLLYVGKDHRQFLLLCAELHNYSCFTNILNNMKNKKTLVA